MALGFNSKTFRTVFSDIENKLNQGEITNRADLIKTLEEKKINPDEFFAANSEYNDALKSGEDLEPGALATPVRIAGRALGEAGRGIGELAEAITPQFIQSAISEVGDEVGEYIPDSVKNNIDEFFDPYHGENAIGFEEGIGTVASYLIGGGLAVKGLKLGVSGIRALSPGARALQRKTLVNIEKAARKNKAAKLLQTTSRAGLTAGTFGAGVAVVERPEDNIVNVLIETFPESEEYLKNLAVNPDDPVSTQMMQKFINNAGFGAAAYPILKPATIAAAYAVKGLGKGINVIGKEAVGKTKDLVNYTGISDYIPEAPRWLNPKINLTANRGTDQVMRQAEISRSKALEAELTEHTQIAKEVQSAVKEEFKAVKPGTPEYVNLEENLNNFFSGQLTKKQTKELQTKAPKTFDLIEKMRNNRTVMQRKLYQYEENKLVNQYIDEGFAEEEAKRMAKKEARVTGELKDIMSGSEGFYTTRTYKVKDNGFFRLKRRGDWKRYKRLGNDADPGGMFSAAVKTVKDTTGLTTDEEAYKFIDDLLASPKNKAEAATDFIDGILTQTNRLTTARATAARKLDDDQKAIRTLLGETTDVSANYIQTMAKLAEMNAEREYLQDVAVHLAKKGGLEQQPGTVNLGDIADERIQRIFGRRFVDESAIKQDLIAKAQQQGKKLSDATALKQARRVAEQRRKTFVNPLDKVYATEEYAKFLKDGLDVYKPAGAFWNAFIKGKGLTQASATILSLPTHGVNMMGNVVLMGANGMYTPGKYFGSLQQVGSRLTGLSNEKLAKRYKRYLDLGIANSGVNINVIRNNFDELAARPETFINKITQRNLLEKAAGLPKRLYKKTAEAYQLEDDLFKIAHFEKTLDYLKKTKKFKGRDLTDPKVIDELEKAAAQRTQDLMPNYSLVPQIIKSGRQLGVGDFMSFPAEMTRISKNLVKYTLDDITSGDDVLFKEGAKRLAGMTAVGVGTGAIMDYSANVNGITKKQREALEIAEPTYNYNSDKIFLSPIQKDANGSSGVDVFHMNRIDPFNFVRSAGKFAHRLLIDEKPFDAAEQDKFVIGMLDQSVGTFLAPSMITDAALGVYANLSGNTYNPRNPDGYDEAVAVFTPLIDVFVPSTAKFLKRRGNYEEQVKAIEESGMERAPIKKGGTAFVEGEVDNLALLGLKRSRLDITGSTPFTFRDSLNKINRSMSFVNNVIRENPNLSDTEENRQTIKDAFLTAQKSRLDGFKEIKALADKYEDIFGSRELAYEEMINGFTSNNKRDIDKKTEEVLGYTYNNMFKPEMFEPSDYMKQQYIMPAPYSQLYNIYDALNGTKIDTGED